MLVLKQGKLCWLIRLN